MLFLLVCTQGASVTSTPGLRALKAAVSDPDEQGGGQKAQTSAMTLDVVISNLKNAVELGNLHGDPVFETETGAFWAAALSTHVQDARYSKDSVPKLLVLLRKWLVEVALLSQRQPKDHNHQV